MTQAEVGRLVAEHRKAKEAKFFLRADQIRDELQGQGIIITADGWEMSRWRAITTGSVLGRGFI